MPSMMTYQNGDLVLVEFPFTTPGAGKLRPALVVLDTGDADVVLARVTTQNRTTAYDVTIGAWQSAGLMAPSIVRLHKLATLAKGRVRRRLGTLDPIDRQQVSAALKQMVAAW
jgi:mRNA interferase MazF